MRSTRPTDSPGGLWSGGLWSGALWSGGSWSGSASPAATCSIVSVASAATGPTLSVQYVLLMNEPWAPAILNPRMAFYGDDFTPRPATEAIFKLLDEEWRTVADLKTDGTGAAPTIDAFIGVYEMTVTIGKETFPAVNVQLPPPADSATAPLTVPGATVTTTKTGVKVTLQVP